MNLKPYSSSWLLVKLTRVDFTRGSFVSEAIKIAGRCLQLKSKTLEIFTGFRFMLWSFGILQKARVHKFYAMHAWLVYVCPSTLICYMSLKLANFGRYFETLLFGMTDFIVVHFVVLKKSHIVLRQNNLCHLSGNEGRIGSPRTSSKGLSISDGMNISTPGPIKVGKFPTLTVRLVVEGHTSSVRVEGYLIPISSHPGRQSLAAVR